MSKLILQYFMIKFKNQLQVQNRIISQLVWQKKSFYQMLGEIKSNTNGKSNFILQHYGNQNEYMENANIKLKMA